MAHLFSAVRAEAAGDWKGVWWEELVFGRKDWAAQSFPLVPRRALEVLCSPSEAALMRGRGWSKGQGRLLL